MSDQMSGFKMSKVYTTSGGQDTEIRKFDFVAKTQFV